MSDTPRPVSARRRRPKAPLWRRVLVVAFLTLVAVILLFHLYALMLRLIGPPGTILMAQRAGEGFEVRRDWAPLEQISPHLVRAVIAAEDAQFCAHRGIDWEAVEKAREWNRKNPDRRRRGGSTISQQTAKNVFFWNGGGMARKAGEAWMTYVIEAIWGKRRIMEVYLNVAEWGDGLFGAEAAAQARFGKSAADLTPLEAARLAAVLPSPNKWSADKPGPYVRKRTRTILSRMNVVAAEGFASCVLEDDPALHSPVDGKTGRPRAVPPDLPDMPEAPETGAEALEAVTAAGAGAPPTVDPDADAALDAALDAAEQGLGEALARQAAGEGAPVASPTVTPGDARQPEAGTPPPAGTEGGGPPPD